MAIDIEKMKNELTKLEPGKTGKHSSELNELKQIILDAEANGVTIKSIYKTLQNGGWNGTYYILRDCIAKWKEETAKDETI